MFRCNRIYGFNNRHLSSCREHICCSICIEIPTQLLYSSWKHAYIILTPLKPHFYIVRLGFTGVYFIFLIFAQKHRLWVLVRTASPSTQSMFWAKLWKISEFLFFFYYLKFFSFGNFFIYLNRHVFVMITKVYGQTCLCKQCSFRSNSAEQ